MNMFARFDEIPVMTLQDIKETKCYGRTDARTHRQCENSIPTTKFAGGIITQWAELKNTAERHTILDPLD